MSLAAACAASTMNTYYSKPHVSDENSEDDILHTGLVKYCQDAIEENELDILTPHVSSKLKAESVANEVYKISAAEASTLFKGNKTHNVKILSKLLKQRERSRPMRNILTCLMYQSNPSISS